MQNIGHPARGVRHQRRRRDPVPRCCHRRSL